MSNVAICICSINKDGILETCLNSLVSKTSYTDYKIYLCVPPSVRSEIVKLPLDVSSLVFIPREEDESYSYSKFANRIVRETEETYICLLNDDIEVISPNWLEVLIDYASIRENGIITPKLLFSDGTIQHVGCALDPEGVCYHLHKGEPNDLTKEWNVNAAYHITVSGACSLLRRDLWDRVGGYENKLTSYNDIDFALKIFKAGYWNVCTPEVSLLHHESWTRGPQLDTLEADKQFMKNKWKIYLNLRLKNELSN